MGREARVEARTDAMRIVVAPHSLELGGSQLNAIDLAGAVRDRGHEVSVFGPPGELVSVIDGLGLRYVEAPPGRLLTLTGARALRALCRREHVDVVHAYEWPPAIDAFYGPHLLGGVPVVCTLMSMVVAPFLPRSMPLVVGTEQIAATARSERGGVVYSLEPPVDTDEQPSERVHRVFRTTHGLDDDRPLVVIVSRLANELKAEGIERAIAAIELLDDRFGARLLIVGDGPARETIQRLANDVNRRLDRPAVTLTGEILDPRPAYAVADVVLGMGGSALRAMAFAKPIIVLGEDGFANPLTPESVDEFLWHGFYGLGDGDIAPSKLADSIAALLSDPFAAPNSAPSRAIWSSNDSIWSSRPGGSKRSTPTQFERRVTAHGGA